jgi:hypothetical protein
MAAFFTYFRFLINYQYGAAPWQSLIDLTAPAPFVYRFLIPLLVRPVVDLTGWDIIWAFRFSEFLATVCLILILYKLLSLWICKQASFICALLFPILLLLPYGLITSLKLYFPSDTPSVAFAAAALLFIFQKKWFGTLLVMIIATLNRETAFIYPFILCCIYYGEISSRTLIKTGGRLILVYLALRIFIVQVLFPSSGPIIILSDGERLRIVSNLIWLTKPQNIMVLLSSLGMLPVLWCCFYSNIPTSLKRLQYASAVYFLLLLFVANVFEPRVFGEIFLMLYIGVAVGFWQYKKGCRKKVEVNQ